MELFKKIEEKSDYVFFYYDVLIDKDVKVPARFKNMTVEQIKFLLTWSLPIALIKNR